MSSNTTTNTSGNAPLTNGNTNGIVITRGSNRNALSPEPIPPANPNTPTDENVTTNGTRVNGVQTNGGR